MPNTTTNPVTLVSPAARAATAALAATTLYGDGIITDAELMIRLRRVIEVDALYRDGLISSLEMEERLGFLSC